MYKAISPGHIGHSVRFVDVAEAVSRAGFEGFWFSLDANIESGAEKTREMLEKHHLKAAGFDLPVDFRGDEASFCEGLEKLPALLDYAKAVGMDRCATWIMPCSNTMDYEENFEFHRARLLPICKMLAERDMIFGLEFVGPKSLRDSMKYPFIHTVEGMLALGDAIGTGNMGILLDAYHWHTAGHTIEDFKAFENERQISVVHINDARDDVSFDDLPDTDRRLPGATGVLPIGEFFDGLKKLGYTGAVVVEPFEPFLKDLSFEDALKAVMDSMVKVWPKD